MGWDIPLTEHDKSIIWPIAQGSLYSGVTLGGLYGLWRYMNTIHKETKKKKKPHEIILYDPDLSKQSDWKQYAGDALGWAVDKSMDAGTAALAAIQKGLKDSKSITTSPYFIPALGGSIAAGIPTGWFLVDNVYKRMKRRKLDSEVRTNKELFNRKLIDAVREAKRVKQSSVDVISAKGAEFIEKYAQIKKIAQDPPLLPDWTIFRDAAWAAPQLAGAYLMAALAAAGIGAHKAYKKQMETDPTLSLYKAKKDLQYAKALEPQRLKATLATPNKGLDAVMSSEPDDDKAIF